MSVAKESSGSEEGWIEWRGGECPVDPEVRVEVRMETLATWDDEAYDFSWMHLPDGHNIIAYRIHKES